MPLDVEPPPEGAVEPPPAELVVVPLPVVVPPALLPAAPPGRPLGEPSLLIPAVLELALGAAVAAPGGASAALLLNAPAVGVEGWLGRPGGRRGLISARSGWAQRHWDLQR